MAILSDDDGDIDELIKAGDGSDDGNSSGENFENEDPLTGRSIEQLSIRFDSFTMEKQDVSPGHVQEDFLDGSDTQDLQKTANALTSRA